MTLEESIAQLINLGEKDPLSIARKIIGQHEPEWVSAELASLAEDLIAELARQRIGSQRRSSELALRPGEVVAQSDMKLASMWIPGEGWKRVADVTAPDLLARAAWYQVFVRAAQRRAQWCVDVAGLMEAEGVRKLGRLKTELPPLPADDALELVA